MRRPTLIKWCALSLFGGSVFLQIAFLREKGIGVLELREYGSTYEKNIKRETVTFGIKQHARENVNEVVLKDTNINGNGGEEKVIASSGDFGQNNEEIPVVEEDYCSPDGGVCAYHNICYDTIEGSWYTSASPIDQFPLLNNMGHSQKFVSNLILETNATCNEKFIPQSNRSYPSESEIIYEEGTTYLVCCWINHFGHIFLQMFVAAVNALEKIGLGKDLKSNTITFLVDNRAVGGPAETVLSFFRFLTKKSDKVLSLGVLEEKAKEDGKNNVCFEKLVVGMLHDNLVDSPKQIEVGMLQPLRDHLDNLHPLTKESIALAKNETRFSPAESESSHESPPECTITVLRRKGPTRSIGNIDNAMDTTKEIFFEPKWNIRTVSFDGPSLKSQYLTARSSMVFVSVSGTGSHMAMFLPNGGSSIEILHKFPLPANKHICKVSPYLNCPPGIKSTCPTEDCKTSPIINVDMMSYRETMEGVKKDISSKCNHAMKSF